MPAKLRAFVVIVALSATALAVLGWQHRTTERLRAERDDQHAALTRLQADRRNEQQEQPVAATRARAEEIDRLLAEHAAVARLREELATLRHRAAGPAAVRVERAPAPVRTGLAGNTLAFSLWQNVGRATPEASLETALWAAANGDIDTLTSLLVFDAEARHEATALFTQLPANLRQEFVSPERLVAVLTAKDVPLGSAALLNQYPTPTETKLSVQVLDAEGKHRLALLSVRLDNGGWRFVVPANAVKRHAAWLRAPPAPVEATH